MIINENEETKCSTMSHFRKDGSSYPLAMRSKEKKSIDCFIQIVVITAPTHGGLKFRKKKNNKWTYKFR